jgi:MSHA biogenesis protein MshP
MKAGACAESGFGLVSAIFLLVILAALGVAMMSFSAAQHAGSAMEAQQARAYQAARAGIEWGLYQSLQAASPSCSATPISFALPASAPAGFTVTVTCVSTAAPNSTPPVKQLQAVACNQPSGGICPPPAGGRTADYVERVAQMTFW